MYMHIILQTQKQRYMYIYVYIYTCIYMYIYKYMCVYVCVHTKAHKYSFLGNRQSIKWSLLYSSSNIEQCQQS